MKTRLRILRQGFFIAVLAFAFAPQAGAADTILYATDITNSRIWQADVTSGVNTLVTNTPSPADSLIFAPNGNILYSLLYTGQLGSYDFNTSTNTILVGGLGHPADLTLEPSGTPSCLLGQTCVLISDYSAGRILRYNLVTHVLSTVVGYFVFNRVDGLTYDNSGKLFAVVNRNSVVQINPVTGVIISQLTGLSGGLDGITFDPVTGDLWVSRYDLGGFWKIPTSLSGSLGPYAGSIPHPDGVESDGNGNLFAASAGTNVYQYNIASNTVTQKNAVPGLDDIAPLAGFGAPPGYIEICKASDPNHPVTGLFTFTATPSFSSGPITVPVGQCSGSIQVPSGAITVTEAPVLGVAVSNVTAYAYDELGFYHDELNSWTQPDLHAIVNVMAGDQDEETLTTFTNYAAPPGLLKLCKVAGDHSTLGQLFQFTVTSGGQRHVYYITAGPPQQGGNCVLAGNFPVNTPVMIAETPNPPFAPSGITVNEGQLMPCTPPSIYCTIATIIPGITEVTFTNKLSVNCDGPNLLINGSFENGDFSGWNTGGNFTNTQVVSGPFYQYSGAEDGGFYAVLGPVGSPGSLSQILPTTRGHTYHVCFWLNAVGDNPSFFNGYWGIPLFVSLANPNTGGVWKQYVYGPFPGTGADTLKFTFRDDPGYIALDHVSVVSP